MSASQPPDISDIHATSVAETLSVTTDPTCISVSQPLVPVGTDPQPTIPSVGASISVQDSAPAGTLSERSSSALLNLASNTLNLTDIITAQQQALEQFQCQLQLAQQTEAINQRLDAIERTLNNLIQQKAQEDAAKQQEAVVVQQHQASLSAQVTPVRPSQQLSLPPDPTGSAESLLLDSSESSKKRKLPRELCAKVRSTYHTINMDFKIDERFLSPANQRVTDTLIDRVFTDTGGTYSARDIKRAAHRYYESRRRLGIEDMPDRQEKAAEQKKKRKYRARQQRTFERRRKFVRASEARYWEPVSAVCMTEESDAENAEKIVTHQLLWRSDFLNQFVQKLDNRYDRSKKPGQNSSVKRERVQGLASTSNPPPGLPNWMVNPNYKYSSPSSVPMCVDPADAAPTSPVVADDEVSYTTLIDVVHEVHDDSSDFELPDTVVA